MHNYKTVIYSKYLLFYEHICGGWREKMMWRVEVETKAEVEVGSSGGDDAERIGHATGEGGADKSAAYSSSPVWVN